MKVWNCPTSWRDSVGTTNGWLETLSDQELLVGFVLKRKMLVLLFSQHRMALKQVRLAVTLSFVFPLDNAHLKQSRVKVGAH